MSTDQHELNRAFALYTVKTLRKAGFQALWAGGCVRDRLLGIEPKDYDVATDARPNQVQSLFRRTVAVGMSFGVIQVLGKNNCSVEVATFRSDGEYSDGRHPDQVTFSTPEQDALRRDFTINGLYFDPIDERIYDFVEGEHDLQSGIIRAIRNPLERFGEDKLRLMRAIRFASRFGFDIDPATKEAICEMSATITQVSWERIQNEWSKMLCHPNRRLACELLLETGLLNEIFPELDGLTESKNDWQQTLDLLAFWTESIDFPLAMACFAWKIRYAERDALFEKVLRRFKVSNHIIDRTLWLVQHFDGLLNASSRTKSYLKRLFAHPVFPLLLNLTQGRAEVSSDIRLKSELQFCEDLLRDWTEDEISPDPILTGQDLMDAGYLPGPLFGEWLEKIRDAQLNEEIHSKSEALSMIESFEENALTDR